MQRDKIKRILRYVVPSVAFLVFISGIALACAYGALSEKEAEEVVEEVVEEEAEVDELSEIVEAELRRLTPGLVLFNPPQEMKVGIKERVEVRITKTITEDLTEGLRGSGVPHIEEIRVNTLMGVRLNGDNFDIKALSHEEQVVVGKGFTQWDWDVVPLDSGDQLLSLVITVRIRIPNYGEERKDYPVLDRQIKVKVNPAYTIKNFIKSYWKWITGTILIPLIVWVVKVVRKLWKSRKKK